MKTFAEIKKEPQIQKIVHERENYMDGYLFLRSANKAFTFVCSIDKDADGAMWEHASVGLCTSKKKTPSWEEMCAVKDIFWHRDEEVHQIHPSEKEYVRSYRGLENILHLWRPVDGWKVGGGRL